MCQETQLGLGWDMQQGAEPGMRLLDILLHFDSALDWPVDDPFLADDEVPAPLWPAAGHVAEVAA